MGRTYINVSAASSANSTVSKARSKVASAKDSFRSTGNGVDSKIKNRNNIGGRINSVYTQLNDIESRINNISATVRAGLEQYQLTENRVSNDGQNVARKAVASKSVTRSAVEAMFISAKSVGAVQKTDKKDTEKTQTAKKTTLGDIGKGILGTIVEEAGYAGSFFTSAAGVINGLTADKIDYGAVAKNGKKVVSTIFKIAKNNEKLAKLSRMNPGQAVKTGLKRMVGLDKAFTGNLRPSVASKFTTRFYNNYQKQLADGLESYSKGGATSVLAWAGVAINGVTNFFENKKEYESGEITKTRAVIETAVETAVDVGTGIVVGAAVSAGIAALGFASAPVLVVGAATAGVIAGLNFASEKLFNKDLTEAISDFAIDAGECVVKGAKKIASKTVETVGKAANAVGSFFKKIF